MSNKSAKALRQNDKKNAASNKAEPKGTIKSGKGKPTTGSKKVAPKKKAKKA